VRFFDASRPGNTKSEVVFGLNYQNDDTPVLMIHAIDNELTVSRGIITLV
jgi:hypothetical protein